MEMIERSEKNGVAQVILNRPQVRNAFNPKMISEITETFNSLTSSKDLRCVVISGNGKSFCAGADLEWMRSMAKFTQAENLKDSQELYEMFAAIKNCPVPVIAKVHGHAMGGALGIIAAADIVIAEEQTEFCFSEAKLGLAPAVISAFVKDKVSSSAMAHLFLTATVFSATHAKQVGLVHAVTDDVAKDTQIVIDQIYGNGPQAVRATKHLISQVYGAPESSLKKVTTELISGLRVGAEGQEGIKSFLERREPQWRSHAGN
ncbi:MAG: enoyl-CoA hydratase/isomerase family protein [Bdellovibrionales bacterium]|nr:enoyl-CoA hydratase/isomerase family protein [Bdellovibrionales bacterium]